jgi:hypothetical protein
MRSFRSILGLALAVLAFGWVRPASAQMTVTGLVAQSSALVRQKLPIYITPRSTVQYVAPWMITSDTVTTRTDTNGAYSFAVLRGNYTVKFGPMTNDWVTIAVESNSGTNNLSDLVTSTNLLFSLTNLMVGATTGADGLSGLVPQPLAGDEVKWLRGDGTWASGGSGGGVTDHGDLTGLADDDHPQYQLRSELGATNAALLATVASLYQPLDADLTAWAAVNPSSYSTTAEASALYQPIGTYATTNVFVGASSVANGTVGLVPKPLAGEEAKFLRADGTWAASAGGGVTDHGALTGLADDDHPQYQLRSQVAATNTALLAVVAAGYQPLDSDLTGWSVTPTNVLSALLSSATAASTYQPLDTDLTAWALVNPSSYLTSAQIAAAYQPLSANLTQWSALGTNTLGSYLLSATAATTYQPLTANGTGWSVTPTNVLSALLSSATAASTYQPLSGNLTQWSALGTNTLGTYANSFSFLNATAVSITPTNHVLDLSGAAYQWMIATNSVYLMHLTNGPGAMQWSLLASNANQVVAWPVSMIPQSPTNGLNKGSTFWSYTLTNGQTMSIAFVRRIASSPATTTFTWGVSP